MRKATNLLITVCCLLLALVACAVTPAKETEKSVSNMPNQTTTQTTTQATEPVVEATKPQDTITTEKYTLFWEDGKSYMEYHPGEGNEASDGNALAIAHYPTFSSIREMREKLITGDLAEEEITELMRNAPKDSDVVEICNINKLYEATYPKDMTLKRIKLFGTGYSFELDNGYIICTSKDGYLSEFDRIYNGKGFGGITILSVEKVADRNAEVTRYDNVGTECSWVRYTNETDYGTQYVMEIYMEDTLMLVYIFGTSNGGYYHADFSGLEERPSLEWISSFGLREYVETEVS